MIVLDTNVLSEQTKPRPSEAVMKWAASIPSAELFTTAITKAEMLIGLEIMPTGRKRIMLTSQIEHIFGSDFADRILPFDGRAAHALSILPLQRDRSGAPIMDADAMIAAIANAHDATVATRNIKDFQRYGVKIVNPWAAV
jgi:predicted nucleic acid-binding protein